MKLEVDIKKKLGDFSLCVQFETNVEPLALLGASGCGKSLTLRSIAGILTPDEGKIILNGKPLFDSAARINLPPQKRHVGYLFQQYALFPHMTVRQNIEFGIRDRSKRNEILARLLPMFRLEELSSLKPAQLSGGQQQRTALARILASSPEAILLDEPLSALDSFLRYQLELELQKVMESFEGPVIWVSHDRGEAYRNCPQVCVLEQGRSQPVMDRDQLIHNPVTEAAARLSGCKNFVEVCPMGNCVQVPQWNVTLDCGRAVPLDTKLAGLRAHHFYFAKEGMHCRILRVTEDVFSVILLLLPLEAQPDASAFRMEISKEAWESSSQQQEVTVTIDPENILLLQA